MEKLLSILNSFNLGDLITQGLNFIDANPFMVIAGIALAASSILFGMYCVKSVQYRNMRATNDTINKFQCEVVENANRIAIENHTLNRTIDQLRDDLLQFRKDYGKMDDDHTEELEQIALKHKSELDKKHEFWGDRIEQLKAEILKEKDANRKLAMEWALRVRAETGGTTDFVIETAQKIYKFYGGKV